MNPHPFFLYPFSALSSLPIFSSTHSLLSLPRARALSLHTPVALSYSRRINLFSGKGRYTRETSDSIIAIMGNRIKCELAGVVHSWMYSCFEALKVRDPRLEPVPHYSYYEDIRGNLEYIGPLGPPSLSMHKKRVNAVCVNPFC